MALTGTLGDFGVAEILQLIGAQKKTGVLTVEDGKLRAEIEFADGMVVGAKGGVDTVSIEDRLVRSGMITRDEIDTALKLVKETLKPLPAVLAGESYIDSAILREVINRHIAEVVYEIFDWKTGTYEFQQKFIQWDKQLIRPIPAESIMMEGLRIVDEGPGVRKLLPTLEDVYNRAEPADVDLKQLEPESRRLYDLADGRKTLKDIILASNQPKFDAMKRLAWMRLNRFILRGEDLAGKDAGSIPVVKRKGPRKLTTATFVALYLLLAVAAGLLVMRIGQSVWNFAAPLSQSDESTIGASAMLGESRFHRVQGALEVFRLRHGKYPESLNSLVDEKLVYPGDIKPLGRDPIPYMTTNSGSGYLLGDAAMAAMAAMAAEGQDR